MHCCCTLEGVVSIAAGLQAQDCGPKSFLFNPSFGRGKGQGGGGQHPQMLPHGDWPTQYSNCIMVTPQTAYFALPARIISQGYCCVTHACGLYNRQACSRHCWCPYVHLGMLLRSTSPCSLLKKAPVTFWLMVFMTRICKWHKRLSSASPPSVMSLQP